MNFVHFTDELLVIVEYCPYGNLKDFLVKNRKNFIDQIDRDKDRIDPTISTQISDASIQYMNCPAYVNFSR